MGAGVKIWGSQAITGIGWLPVLLDAAGHLQIDLASTSDVNIASSDITLDTRIAFGGTTYENQKTQANNNANRFETTTKKLRDVIIKVTTYGQLFGDSSNQRFPVAAGDAIGFTKVDVSTLYFKNAASGEDGVVTILGVEE